MADTFPINNLDFDGIRQNLTEYLKNQEAFKNFDFEGSALSQIISLLAYNTHYNAYYANMAATESFLDSAQTRNSVVSLAKHLGYTPRSKTASKAIVKITGLSSSRSYVYPGETFTATVDGVSYSFTPIKPYKVVEGVVESMEIYEGFYSFTTFVVGRATVNQRFVLPSNDIDTTTIRVKVQQSVTNTNGLTDSWQLSNDINTVDGESKVYFLQETENEYFEIYFGDNIVGMRPDVGNLIIVSYVITTGEEANGFGTTDSATNRVFTFDDYPQADVEVLSPAMNGSDPETLESIKYYAPRNFAAQDRAVTEEDYRVLLAREYTDIDSVYVWGGEENDPPIYGKVFISLKPITGTKLTNAEKISVAKNILGDKNIVGIIPEIVDPEYIYLRLNASVNYDSRKTTKSGYGIETFVKQTMIDYTNKTLDQFQRSMRYSKLLAAIDDSDASILNSSVDITMERRFEPTLSLSSIYTIHFHNPIYHPQSNYTQPVVSSSVFGYADSTSAAAVKPNVDAYFDDDGNGNIRIYKLVNGAKVFLNATAGTVDYETGKVVLTNFFPQYLNPLTNTEIVVYASPSNKDINSLRNTILTVDATDSTSIDVIATAETINTNNNATGTAFGG